MPLDRTWFNALVDDDGSNTVGTVWNKTQIDALLDSVDAALPQVGTWTPVLSTDGGGEPLYADRSGVYVKSGALVYVGGRVNCSSKGTLPASSGLKISNLPAAVGFQVSGITIGYCEGLSVTNVTSFGTYLNAGTDAIFLNRTITGGTGTSRLRSDEIGASFIIIFGGTYRST